MSKRLAAKDGEPTDVRGSHLDFCKHTGCMEFAQTSDPAATDTRKYYCVIHEAAAVARGESGDRMKVELPHAYSQPIKKIDHAQRARRNKEIAVDLAAGRIPGQTEEPPIEELVEEEPALVLAPLPVFAPAAPATAVEVAVEAPPVASPPPAAADHTGDVTDMVPATPPPETTAAPAASPVTTPEPKGVAMRQPARQVMCLDTKEVWENREAAAKALGCSVGGLGAALAPSGPGKIHGKQVQYVDDDKKAKPATKAPRQLPSPPPPPRAPVAAAAAGPELLQSRAYASIAPASSSIAGVFASIAGMLMQSRSVTMENVEIEHHSADVKLTVRIKQVSLSAGGVA